MSDPIGRLVKAVVDGTLADDELIEWLRNVFENGLDSESTIRLTEAMRDSGVGLEWPAEWAHLVVD